MSTLKKALASSFLLSFEAVLKKLVGLISTLILARVLVPDDFGLIAIALMVMGFIDAMKEFGGGAYLLKSETIDDDMINTAWTISTIADVVMALLLVVASPFIASYYDDERLVTILWAFSGIWVIRTLGNPALVMLRREQNYLPIIKLSIITKVFSVIIVIISAFTFKSYWALVIGQFTTYLSMTVGGYIIYRHRIKFCLKGFKKQWAFSGWWMLQSIFGFIKSQLDTFLVSSMFNKAALGSYHTIKYFASMPTSFLLDPAMGPLLVELRKIKSNENYFKQQFNISLIVPILVAFPLSVFLVKEHYLVTATLLGANWIEYSELFSIFCVSITTYVVQRQTSTVMVIFGNTKGVFYFQLFSFIAVYGVLLSQNITSVSTFANTKVFMEALVVLGLLFFVSLKYTSIKNIFNLIVGIMPIFAASSISSFLTVDTDPQSWVFIQLVIKALNFFILYLIFVLLLGSCLRVCSGEWRYILNLARKAYANVLDNFKPSFYKG